MSHYFENDPSLKSKIREISCSFNGKNFVFKSDSGVFSNKEADLGSLIFVKTLLGLDLKGKILDLGCGYGTVGILLNSFNKNVEITYSDVNPKCVELTSNNLRQYDLNGKCLLSDGYLNIDERYDFILFNPPIRAGKEVIYRLYNESLEHLNEGGKLYLVIRKDKGALSHMKYLESIGAPSRIINKDKGYLVIECL